MQILSILGFSKVGANASAHEAHFGTIAYNEKGQARHVIFKKNKHPGRLGEQASELEACFTAVANAISAPQRNLEQDIVRYKNGSIAGVCAEHAAHALLRLRAADNDIVFLQANKKFTSSAEVSEAEFHAWIESHKPITTEVSDAEFLAWAYGPDTRIRNPMPEKEAGEVNSSKAVNKWEEFKAIHDAKEALDKFGVAYFQRLHDYWQERRDVAVASVGPLDEKTILACSDYVQCLLDEDLPLDLNAVPADVIARDQHEVLAMIYEWESLKRKCDDQFLANVQQEFDVSNHGVGKGFNFLDKLPQNFFAKLLAEKNKGNITIDMDSLADVFTTAYGLEEDDLHKGNIGYYVTLEADKPCFHFFKIDNDLMFSQKMMATRSARLANLTYTGKEFRINAADLQGFPDLRHSGNHYWPTKRAFFVAGDKAYQSLQDRLAYQSLKHDPDFEFAKWQRFLKQAVIPIELISKGMKKTLDDASDVAEAKSTLATILRATSSRFSELRVALVEVPEFRKFILENQSLAEKFILNELQQYATSLGCTNDEIDAYRAEVSNSLKAVVMASTVSNSNTALHTAVIAQAYRCFETSEYFYSNLNNKDSHGLTALDWAITYYEIYTDNVNAKGFTDEQHGYNNRMRTYYADVICDLTRHQAEYTSKTSAEFATLLAEAKQTSSLSMQPPVTSLEEYKKELGRIRSQPMGTLKHDKECALELLRRAHLSKDELLQLKEELKPTEPEGALKFIKELRSDIWIVKYIRGAYGTTATSREMFRCIDSKIADLDRREEQRDALNPVR
ncbi:hypothetical protein J2N86_12950 [Legionella lytica]|uniref:Dot/Icm T4SS effector n=1 Tax=Legionella lytica TaxID=96232 RepID=A0ABY4Y7F0_9GAMM|nr:hypothetical protein [Legionella lytica]USQ13573.1 hypothetical protein J2N86_12950 [Legionella lytica]